MNALNSQPLKSLVLTAWQATCVYVASNYAQQFSGANKETKVLRQLRQDLSYAHPSIQFVGPDNQAKFKQWEIDLVCILGDETIAIEGKYKIESDGAIPDNRKLAFFDIYKLEQYVSSGNYSRGLFLWLTNVPNYLREPTGDSSNFSTHHERMYLPNTPLTANRAKNKMPLPLILSGQYAFNWQHVLPYNQWHMLTLEV